MCSRILSEYTLKNLGTVRELVLLLVLTLLFVHLGYRCLLFTKEYLRVYLVSIKQYTLIVNTQVGTEIGDIYCTYFVLLLRVFQV